MSPQGKRVGRPTCPVSADSVARMRVQGISWRQIAHTLKIGTATARRLYAACQNPGKVCQNSPQVPAGLEVASRLPDPTAGTLQQRFDHTDPRTGHAETAPELPAKKEISKFEMTSETTAGRATLRATLEEFVKTVQDRFPERARRRPAALKKGVMLFLRALMPPHAKPCGRPRQRRITEAVEDFRAQQREIAAGRQEKVDWRRIALERVPGFSGMNQYRRRAELVRLRAAVHARLRRKRQTKRAP